MEVVLLVAVVLMVVLVLVSIPMSVISLQLKSRLINYFYSCILVCHFTQEHGLDTGGSAQSYHAG